MSTNKSYLLNLSSLNCTARSIRRQKNFVKPLRLKKGDKIAAVSLSWGGAGDADLIWRYKQGKERLENLFGLKVVEMPNTLKGTEYIYDNPQKRAEDLMNAFLDKSIKGIFCTIGGNDSIKILPYINFDIIRNNPKIFVGFSDNTITNLICMKAGLVSFYGPSIMNDFAENVAVPTYTVNNVRTTFFCDKRIGEIHSPEFWTSEFLEWDVKNKNISRKFSINNPYCAIQGSTTVEGQLIGGCMDVLMTIIDTELFPTLEEFEDTILFLETSEETPTPLVLENWLCTFGNKGILSKVNGIIFAKPYNEKYFNEYIEVIKKVMKKYGKENLPILFNLTFGHCEPRFCIPYGVKAEINCTNASFSILENSVV